MPTVIAQDYPIDGLPLPARWPLVRLSGGPFDNPVYVPELPPVGATVATTDGRYTVLAVEWQVETAAGPGKHPALVPVIRVGRETAPPPAGR